MTKRIDQFEAVLFDLDGTMVDTQPDLVAAAVHVAEVWQIQDYDQQAVASQAGRGASKMLSEIWPDYTKEQLQPMLQEFLRYYEQNIAVHTSLFPGVETIMEHFGLRSAIVTNKYRRLTDMFLQQFEGGRLARDIGCVVANGDLPLRKPHPLPLIWACHQLGVQPKRTLWLGDTVADLAAGHDAGAMSYLIDTGYEPPYRIEQAKRYADVSFDSMLEVVDYLFAEAD